MPELPEVETVVNSIRPFLVGKQIVSAMVRSQRVTRGNHATTVSALQGATIEGVRRQGKQILIDLDNGLLYIHLGMTGRLLWNSAESKYTRAALEFNDGRLVFDDTRMFGRVEFFAQTPPMILRVGPDALVVSFPEFFMRLQRFRGRIKPVLLNQVFVAGVGNIYADEALFASRIHPKTPVRRLSRERAERLYSALLHILRLAIEHRGSSISNYVDGRGAPGSFQQLHNVYGREDHLCPACATPIRKIVLAQRGTHYCPRCQRV